MSKSDKKAKNQPKGDYAVGYCRTPVSSRYKPGQSGNPAGRSPERKDLTAEIGKRLAQTRSVTISGMPTKLSMMKILLERLIERAANGDAKLALFLLGEEQKYRARKRKQKAEQRFRYTLEELKNMPTSEIRKIYRQAIRDTHGPGHELIE